ncbi:MAG: hypothetical protein ACXWPM_06685, partial [Bdellovibrionota bacterium]
MKKIYELPSWLKDPFFAILALAFFAALGIGSVARAEDGFPKVDQIPCNRPIDPKDSDGVQRAKHFLCVDRSLDHFLHSYFYSEYRPFYWNQLGFGDFELEALAKSDPELMAFWGRLKNQRESLGYENLRQNGGSAAWEEFDRKYIAWLVLPENAVQVAKLMRKLDPEAIQKGLDEIDGHWGIRASFHIGEDWDYYRQNVQFRDKVSRVLGEIRKHREPFLAQAPIPPTEKAETSVGAMPERPADYLFLLRLLDLRHLSFQDPPIRDEFTLHQLVDHTFQKNEELYSSATGLLDRFERVSESDGPEAARKWVDANRAEVLEVVRSLNLPKLRDWATDAVSSKSLKPFQLKLQSSYDELARFQTGASALASRGRSSGGEAGQICGMIADRLIQDQRIDPEFLFKLALKNPGDPVLTRLFFGSKAGETASPAVAKVFDSIDI